MVRRAIAREDGVRHDLQHECASLSIQEAWKYYSKRFTLLSFDYFVTQKASAHYNKHTSVLWWKSLFDYSKSFIVIVFLIYALTPRGALQVSSLGVVYYVGLAAVSMVVCTVIEWARYANDMGIALRTTTLDLISGATDPAISDADFEAAKENITRPSPLPMRQRSKFLCVSLMVAIPYFGSIQEWVRAYKFQLAKYRRPRTSVWPKHHNDL